MQTRRILFLVIARLVDIPIPEFDKSYCILTHTFMLAVLSRLRLLWGGHGDASGFQYKHVLRAVHGKHLPGILDNGVIVHFWLRKL